MNEYELLSPSDAATWAAYHDIRRTVLFEARGRIGAYDANRPDETAPGHHPKVLSYRGEVVGVVRVDMSGSTATFRRVAIRGDRQRRGHGRMLLALAEQFAKAQGCRELMSHVAPDAVRFYAK
jgi:GNAT superfamily N-acetyltransferase